MPLQLVSSDFSLKRNDINYQSIHTIYSCNLDSDDGEQAISRSVKRQSMSPSQEFTYSDDRTSLGYDMGLI